MSDLHQEILVIRIASLEICAVASGRSWLCARLMSHPPTCTSIKGLKSVVVDQERIPEAAVAAPAFYIPCSIAFHQRPPSLVNKKRLT